MINEAFVNEYSESAQDFCFIFGVHRQIRILPITEDAEPFELLALDVDELPRKRFRFFANFQGRKAAGFLDDLVFDRQSMTIPARYVRGAFAEHGLRFDHEVFEDFVERRAHVHVSIGEWRPVMQYK